MDRKNKRRRAGLDACSEMVHDSSTANEPKAMINY